MKKLTELQYNILRMIAAAGGSFCPDASTSAEAHRALYELVKAKRLSTEDVDDGYRYHLTEQGREDAR